MKEKEKIELELSDINMQEDFEYFKCSNGSLNKYLKSDAYYEHIMHFANTKLVKSEVFKNEFRVAAFFTMEFKKIEFNEDGDNFEYPCICLKYLATDINYESKGIGTRLLKYISSESEKISKFVGCRCLFIDAVQEDIQWYLDRGFQLIDEDSVNSSNPTVEMFIDFRDNDEVDNYFNE